MKRLLFCTALVVATASAQAQTTQPAPPENPTVPVPPPSNSPLVPPERIAPPGGATLSDRLSKGQGTIAPPKDVDPGMTVRPSPGGAGNMPVIPPPGSPGGNRSVVPK
jgi:hypothetical protein